MEASCWDTGKMKAKEHRRSLSCSELLADPVVLVVGVALQGLSLG